MGYYIPGPPKGKAEFIVNEYQGEIVNMPLYFNQFGDDKVVICVVDNGPFEAAGYCFSEDEFQVFSCSADNRPKTWLVMNKEKAEALSHYK